MSKIETHHREWLNLIEVEGPFLALPVLADVFPNGLEDPDDTSEIASLVRAGLEEWELGLESGDSPTVHDDWVWFVLRRVLGYEDEILREKGDLPADLSVSVLEHGEVLEPDYAVVNPKGDDLAGAPRLLIQIVPPDQALDRPIKGKRWKATPEERMAELLRGAGKSGVPLGLLTNGTRWSLVHAPRGETVGKGSWDATIWPEERITLRAFRSLLGARRFFLDPALRLETLFQKSGEKQQGVTDQLGRQVRRALEVIVQKFDELDRSSGRALLRGVGPRTLYESSVTIMMRLVFLFYAEEQQLLSVDEPLYARDYSASNLLDQLQEESDRHGPQVLERRHSAWVRLLAIFRAVHGGVEHEALRLPAYGGSLFDPDRFPFLEGRSAETSWRTTPAQPLQVDDRTVLQILGLLQFLGDKGIDGRGSQALRLSFKGLGVEQIGHVYEGLLDHTAVRASEVVLGLKGTKGLEPEIPISKLENERAKGDDHFASYLKDEVKLSANQIEKAFEYEIDSGDGRWLVACDNDSEVLDRIAPYAGFVRDDPSGHPVVVPKGSCYVTQGSDRRSTGAHYTPPSLTEPVVKHTLEPLVYEGPAEGKPEAEWKLRSPRELLALRVCDLAMGSGAFLVAACRYLAERLVEAWEACEQSQPGKILVSPDGDLSEGDPREALVPADSAERLAAARRFVADRCLYGVDKDPMAVEMAKLSLWLVTLQKGKPFSFLDHALKNGDSLLGISHREQLEAFDFSTEGKGQLDLFGKLVGEAMTAAREKRERLAGMAVNDVRDSEEKARLLAEANTALGIVRQAGDLLIAAALSTAGESESTHESRRGALAEALGKALDPNLDQVPRQDRLANLRHQARKLLEVGKPASERERVPFHWPLEFPEVFENGGFDAFVGNPPFQGGKKIRGSLGQDLSLLLRAGYHSVKGSPDLVVFFLLRAAGLTKRNGCIGLICTNSLFQGESREASLSHLDRTGLATLYRSVRSQAWPGDASVHVSIVWLRVGSNVFDGVGSLRAEPHARSERHKLRVNSGICYQGTNIVNSGFVLDESFALELVAEEPKYAEVVFPLVEGKAINSHAGGGVHLRWIIDFHDWSLDRARSFPKCLEIVEREVKPLRLESNRKRYRDYWWLFGERQVGLYRRAERLSRVIAIAYTSSTLAFVFAPASGVVFYNCTVICDDRLEMLGLLQSSLHLEWIREFGSTLRSDIRYAPERCFETFPFAHPDGAVATAADSYVKHRETVVKANSQGLTKIINRFHEPNETSDDIERLRELHVEMDNAVAAAYGWDDLGLGHDFYETDQGTRYTLSPAARREVLDRLLKLNHERYAEEVAQGLHDKTTKTTKEKTARKKQPTDPPQAGLFDALTSAASQTGASGSRVAAIVYALRTSGEPLSKSDLLTATGISASAWNASIQEALESGQVFKRGERRGTRYSLATRGKR